MIPATLSQMGLGLILGLRHAFEADHLAAVSTIVSRERNPLRSCFIGAFWGLGHLASLLLVGLPVVGLGVHLPRGLDVPLELGIAGMIVLLGVGGLKRAGPPGHGHSHSLRDLGRRPFWVGAAHGLAGSGALTLLILATMPSRLYGLLYLGAFGLGSVMGMTAAGLALAIPIAMSRSGGSHAVRLSRAVSVASIVFGLFYGSTILSGAIAGGVRA